METVEKKKNHFLESILSGVNYMLPCVVAGGIMLGVSFLLDDISINPDTYGTNLPLAAFFNNNGNVIWGYGVFQKLVIVYVLRFEFLDTC